MKTPRNKVIITCAITGSVHTPSMSPYLPVTPEEIAQSALDAAEAGAAIVHLHARQPGNGRPTQDPAIYERFLPRIKDASDVVVNITTGGSPVLPVSERLQPAARFQPEVASLNMGSMNFGMYELLERFKEFRHDWERPYLEGSADLIFRNTFKDIAHILAACADNGTRFEIECYDIGHLYTAAHFVDRGLLEPPFLIQSVFGIRGGIGTHPEDVMAMKRTADRLFGDAYVCRCWRPDASRRRWPPWPPPWAATCAWGWRTRCGTARASWPAPMPTRCAASAAFSTASRCSPPRRTRPGRFSRSRDATTSPSRAR